MVQYLQINKCDIPHKQNKKSHDISIDAERTFGKIQHPFLMKTLTNVGTEGTYLSIIKAMYDKPTASSMLSGQKPHVFPLKLGTRQRCQF